MVYMKISMCVCARAPLVCVVVAARLSVPARASPPAAEPPVVRHSEESPAV